ncbi:MAG: sigma-70 family RNA polymerase sigma factor [Oscillospiraceae bacterium]
MSGILPELSEYSDNELLDKSVNCCSESGVIAELVSRYMKTVFSCAARYAGSADYEELVSDGMQGLLNAIRSFNPEKGEFAAYAGVCIENRMKTAAKRAVSRTSHISDSDSSLEQLERVPDPAPTPEELIMRREDDKAFLENLRHGLSEMELRCIEGVVMGFSYEEIASRLGTDRKAVDNALSRARAKLRQSYNL